MSYLKRIGLSLRGCLEDDVEWRSSCLENFVLALSTLDWYDILSGWSGSDLKLFETDNGKQFRGMVEMRAKISISRLDKEK